ncbi:hypothetical protein GN244_ATG18938, partial [Phytophthora infestans]
SEGEDDDADEPSAGSDLVHRFLSDQRVAEEAQLRVESDATVDMWMTRQEKWVKIAYEESNGEMSTKTQEEHAT